MRKAKIGDVVVSSFHDEAKGLLGTVAYIRPDGRYLIDYGESFAGHEGSGYIQYGYHHYWWVWPEHLSVVSRMNVVSKSTFF